MRVIAIVNHKGGCGKTTTSINLSACLAHLGKKVLLIDVDPQGHSSCGLRIRAESLRYTLYDLLSPTHRRPIPLDDIRQPINAFFHIIPSYGILNAIEEELVLLPDNVQYLKKKLRWLIEDPEEYDYVLLDCPPHLGLLTFNALEACDEVIIPIEPSYFSLHGLAKIIETLKALNQRRVHPIEIHALLTLFNSETSFAKEVYDNIKTHFQERLFHAIIHENVLLKEAASAGESILVYAPESAACSDYLHLAKEYLERELARVLPASELGWQKVLDNRFGPRKVPGGILFQAYNLTAKDVELAGDFNHWIPEPLIRRTEEGLWQKVIPVLKGHYRYKFIIDGEWQLDPYQSEQRSNAFGTTDSFLNYS